MAFIDKIYAPTFKEWNQAKTFIEQSRFDQIICLGKKIGISLTITDATQKNTDILLCSTSVIDDIWLYKNCKIPFIQNYLTRTYGNQKSPLFKAIDFSQSYISIMQVTSKNSNIYFCHSIGEGKVSLLEPKDEVLVYGTTNIFRVLNEVKQAIRGRIKFKGEIIINFFGAIVSCKNGNFSVLVGKKSEKLEALPYFNDDVIKLPKIKYSFDKKDFPKFNGNSIFFSTETEVIPLTLFKGWENYEGQLTDLSRFGLPIYIIEQLKK